MREVERIADQLRLLFEGPSWLGPSIYGLLADIEPPFASNRPLPGAHTIAELVLHMTAWLRIARERLSATSPVDPSSEEDWPPLNEAWEDAVASLRTEVLALEKSVLAFPPERLDEPAPAAEPQSFYVLLHGVIQHSAYHAGQIALLRAVILRDGVASR